MRDRYPSLAHSVSGVLYDGRGRGTSAEHAPALPSLGALDSAPQACTKLLVRCSMRCGRSGLRTLSSHQTACGVRNVQWENWTLHPPHRAACSFSLAGSLLMTLWGAVRAVGGGAERLSAGALGVGAGPGGQLHQPRHLAQVRGDGDAAPLCEPRAQCVGPRRHPAAPSGPPVVSQTGPQLTHR